MISEPNDVFTWVWLPGSTKPVVAGVLKQAERIIRFTYGQSYLAREDAIPLYLPELPLERGPIAPAPGPIAGCIADAAPDAWGMRVVLARLLGRSADDVDLLSQMTYLIESGSDRIGALDFQRSATDYVPRGTGKATLEELMGAAERVQNNLPLSPDLDEALMHGSSIGGARPKAVLHEGDRSLIAKFSSNTDTYPVVKGEFISMELAARADLRAARVEMTRSLERDVLLVERFDRGAGGTRRAMVSALTMLGLDEVSGRYASYADLADVIRGRFTDSEAALRELFSRITFNILTGNNDDHARNHAAFWDGSDLTRPMTSLRSREAAANNDS
jgi:serine/threonine-protein kinase HipA